MARRIDSVADTIQRCRTISVFAAGHGSALAENLRCDYLEAALLTGTTNFKVARFIATVRKFPAGSSNAWQSPE
ncbi:hypothetical protein CCYS_07240 [Corynebacterium cystitidis DSM 20524]|uniref:Uncharacterized protein n=1 Tax=Corynebacterium cystitidis DSM 20524 TaxID=1121357 RepID=A0A1H9PUQ3_9CORY|nr:hypothetical protein [Corynebacterium cystitidis]WJY82373.1 hypothetical protein CCYS_07240 [Corynebacterium cystitidis DSM 20524]SER51957.1 hypothetical protein SAMN05661109_00469 [Corynebacterium cystitidis DSM 20524]SNV76135.1 Uncharacterised protein [Corynebacterium cystitidis]